MLRARPLFAAAKSSVTDAGPSFPKFVPPKNDAGKPRLTRQLLEFSLVLVPIAGLYFFYAVPNEKSDEEKAAEVHKEYHFEKNSAQSASAQAFLQGAIDGDPFVEKRINEAIYGKNSRYVKGGGRRGVATQADYEKFETKYLPQRHLERKNGNVIKDDRPPPNFRHKGRRRPGVSEDEGKVAKKANGTKESEVEVSGSSTPGGAGASWWKPWQWGRQGKQQAPAP